MHPLKLDDILPLQEYAGRRGEYIEAFERYRNRYRRVQIGPKVTLLFENRQTLWYRLHEIVRVARLKDPRQLQSMLDLYNTLLPGRGALQAAMLINIENESEWEKELAPFREFTADQLQFQIGKTVQPAKLITCRPEDLSVGVSHWVEFAFDADGRQLLADFSNAARLDLSLPQYPFQSDSLSDEIRQSLMEDLELSDKDE